MVLLAPPTFPLAAQLPASVSTRSLVGSSGSIRTGSTVTLGRGKGPSSSSTLNLEKSRSKLQSVAQIPESNSADDLVPPLAYSSASLNEKAFEGPEPRTLAWYLFWVGFVFPLCWLGGGFLLVCPSTFLANADTEGGAYDSIQAATIRRATAERKWARRCLYAAGIAICLGLLIGIAIWRGLESRGS